MVLHVGIAPVTPAQAVHWLQKNHRNRRLSLHVVDDMVRAMQQGDWALNGEAIKIAEDGTLLDGQHRLTAVVKSGVTVELLVVKGLPLEAQDTMDTGRKRLTADVFTIHGESNANVLASLCRRVWHWDQGNKRFAKFSNPSTAELSVILDRYPSLRRSTEIGLRTNHSYRPAGATVAAFAHHLLSRTDEGDCALFFAQLATGAELKDGHPVLSLRNRLLRDREAQKRILFHTSVGLYVRAWNAVREGRDLQVLIQAPEANIPPIV